MCGINGFLLNNACNKTLLEKYIRSMNDRIVHRGPDSDGEFIYGGKDVSVGLGMRRLSIIDLATGDQPIFNANKSKVIIFNGEIYNYLDLRKKVLAKGYPLRTNSDTEVVLAMYDLYGDTFIEELNGMFGFAIFDIIKEELIIGRDRFGEKPIYFYSDNEKFFFASELKSIKTIFSQLSEGELTISKKALNLYFQLTYIPAPYTIYTEVHKLNPGHLLRCKINSNAIDVSIEQYWNFLNHEGSPTTIVKSFEEAKKYIYELLFDSVEKRMIADVPIGAFLSGGIDSSIVTAIMANLNGGNNVNTFSIGFKDSSFDESFKAELVSKHLNTKHHSFYLTPDELIEEIDNILLNFDEPFADSSALPTYYVAKKARDIVKVALTGDGGDEVFGGYNRYLMTKLSKKYINLTNKGSRKVVNFLSRQIPLFSDKRGIIFKAKKFLASIDETSNDEQLFKIISLGFMPSEIELLLLDQYLDFASMSSYKQSLFNNLNFKTPIHRARELDFMVSLEGDMLVKVDRASMLTSLECRAPFLDHRLAEYSFKLPENFLVKGKSKKYILKETFSKLLPDNLFQYPKAGFGIPVGNWLRKELREELVKFSKKEFLEMQGIFRYAYVQRMIMNHLNSIQDQTFNVWSFYCFQKWWVNQHT